MENSGRTLREPLDGDSWPRDKVAELEADGQGVVSGTANVDRRLYEACGVPGVPQAQDGQDV